MNHPDFRTLTGIVAPLVIGVACATGIKRVPTTTTPPDQPRGQVVPHPPPPAFPEVVPDAPPMKGAAWMDGNWRWTGQRYVWRRGGWVVPPNGARLVPWTLEYETDGTLRFAPSEWLNAQGEVLRGVRMAKPADYPPTRRQVGERVE